MPWAIISVGIFHIKTIIPNKKERLQVLYLKAFFFHSSLFQTVGLTHKYGNPTVCLILRFFCIKAANIVSA